MNTIEIFDSTLRDGGFCNNWLFGEDTTQQIIKALNEAHVDWIEYGVISRKSSPQKGRTVFNTFTQAIDSLRIASRIDRAVFFVNCRSFSFATLDGISAKKRPAIRLAFYKNDVATAFEQLTELKRQGYKLFLHPMVTPQYDKNEYYSLIHNTNKLMPECIHIVDSFGSMLPSELNHYLIMLDQLLNSKIAIGIHIHNNLCQATACLSSLLSKQYNHHLIIDGSLMGMGRGAGNLKTEELLQLGNLLGNKEYNVEPVISAIEKEIAIKVKDHPWGCSIAYYLSATNKCHPYYAKFFSADNSLSAEEIHALLQQVHNQGVTDYYETLAKQILEKYKNNI